MQERNGGVEGRFTYTEAGFNDYFNFPSSLRVNLIALQSGHAILALPNAKVTFQLPSNDRCSKLSSSTRVPGTPGTGTRGTGTRVPGYPRTRTT